MQQVCSSSSVADQAPHCLTPALCQVRPYLMADGGNVEFVEIDGPVVSWCLLLCIVQFLCSVQFL